jgi:hypothetical protein
LRRKGILALAVVASLALGVGVASAATKYLTKIVFLGTEGPPSDLTLFGNLDTKRKCRAAREMGLFKQTSNGYKLVDVDLSSFNGAWALPGGSHRPARHRDQGEEGDPKARERRL